MAQSRRSIRVKAGEDLAQAYSKNGFYRLPVFATATLYFKSGLKHTGTQFNYNILANTLQFIGPKKDTLEVSGVAEIDSVVFENNTLYVRDGIAELVAIAGPVRLIKKTVIKMQAENIGAYGQANPTSSIINYNNYFSGINVYNLSINQDIVIVETANWYFMDANKALQKANKATLLELLPADSRGKAEEYLKQNKTNFEKEQDLMKLMKRLAD
jgi:hypothetical protein